MLVGRAFRACRGAIAQLGERLNGIQEVGGSIPPGSTNSVVFVTHCVKVHFLKHYSSTIYAS